MLDKDQREGAGVSQGSRQSATPDKTTAAAVRPAPLPSKDHHLWPRPHFYTHRIVLSAQQQSVLTERLALAAGLPLETFQGREQLLSRPWGRWRDSEWPPVDPRRVSIPENCPLRQPTEEEGGRRGSCSLKAAVTTWQTWTLADGVSPEWMIFNQLLGVEELWRQTWAFISASFETVKRLFLTTNKWWNRDLSESRTLDSGPWRADSPTTLVFRLKFQLNHQGLNCTTVGLTTSAPPRPPVTHFLLLFYRFFFSVHFSVFMWRGIHFFKNSKYFFFLQLLHAAALFPWKSTFSFHGNDDSVVIINDDNNNGDENMIYSSAYLLTLPDFTAWATIVGGGHLARTGPEGLTVIMTFLCRESCRARDVHWTC